MYNYNVCIVITVAMEVLLRDIRLYVLVFTTMCVYYFGLFLQS
jgi:hypothetical protein